MATINYADAYQQAIQQAFYDGHLFSADLWQSPANSVIKFDGAKHIKVPRLTIDEGRRQVGFGQKSYLRIIRFG